MAWLKIYQWERIEFMEFDRVNLDRHQQGVILRKLVRHFKTTPVELAQSYKRGGGGSYHHRKPPHYPSRIKCHKTTTLGLICHEFAHHLDRERYGGRGHRKSFKKALKRVYRWAKRWLPEKEATNEKV